MKGVIFMENNYNNNFNSSSPYSYNQTNQQTGDGTNTSWSSQVNGNTSQGYSQGTQYGQENAYYSQGTQYGQENAYYNQGTQPYGQTQPKKKRKEKVKKEHDKGGFGVKLAKCAAIALVFGLISGSVLVEYNDLKSQVILKPNEQLAYNKNTHYHSLDHPDMKEVTAWQRGELVFREMSVKDIITILERKYPYTFEYQLKTLKDDRYSFRFKDQAPLSEVMDVIVNVVGQMDYKIKGDRCYLIPK